MVLSALVCWQRLWRSLRTLSRWPPLFLPFWAIPPFWAGLVSLPEWFRTYYMGSPPGVILPLYKADRPHTLKDEYEQSESDAMIWDETTGRKESCRLDVNRDRLPVEDDGLPSLSAVYLPEFIVPPFMGPKALGLQIRSGNDGRNLSAIFEFSWLQRAA